MFFGKISTYTCIQALKFRMQALFFMQIQNSKSDFRFFDFLLFLGIKSETNHDSWSMRLWRSITDRPFDQIHILVPIEPHIFVCVDSPLDTKFKLILVLTRPFTKNTNVSMKFWWEILFINAVAIPVMSGKTILYMIIGL